MNVTPSRYRRQAGVSIIEYIVLGAVLVLGLVFGVSQFRDSATAATETVGSELGEVAAGASLAERYGGSGSGVSGSAGADLSGGEISGSASGEIGAQGVGNGAFGIGARPRGAPDQTFSKGLNGDEPTNEEAGTFARGPHIEGGRRDRDGDGSYDFVHSNGSAAGGKSTSRWGWFGASVDGDLLYFDAEGGMVQDDDGSYAASHGKVKAGVARGGGKLSFGPDGSPITESGIELDGPGAHGGADDLFFEDDGDRIGYASAAGGGFQLIAARVFQNINIPIPFTEKAIGWKAGASAGAGGAGVDVDGHGYYDRRDERFHLGGALAGMFEGGLGGDIDFYFGKRDRPKGYKKGDD